MLVKSLIILIMRKGEELKALCHASAVVIYNIFPIALTLYCSSTTLGYLIGPRQKFFSSSSLCYGSSRFM